MISRYESKDGQRVMIAISPDEDICIAEDGNGIYVVEGPKDALRGLYEFLADLFGGEDND